MELNNDTKVMLVKFMMAMDGLVESVETVEKLETFTKTSIGTIEIRGITYQIQISLEASNFVQQVKHPINFSIKH